MLIKQMRISVIQAEAIADPFRALERPQISFPFLLSAGLFKSRYTQASMEGPPWRAPWRADYGWQFWLRYREGIRKPRENDLWRLLVPLGYAPAITKMTPTWQGEAKIGTYLYPWGIAAMVDVSVIGSMSFDEAVAKALDIRWSAKIQLELDGSAMDVSLPDLIHKVFESVRRAAYGAEMSNGDLGNAFTVVTVLDAEGADGAVSDGDDTHRHLEAFASWNKLFQKLKLEPLANNTIAIRQPSPEGHILYKERNGRAVWFPQHFLSVAPDPLTLPHYHQNLTMASLQTESLCRLANDAAKQLSNAVSFVNLATDYDACTKLAAGILARLYGGVNTTYRNRSVRYQIQDNYAEAVNLLRKHHNMPELKP